MYLHKVDKMRNFYNFSQQIYSIEFCWFFGFKKNQFRILFSSGSYLFPFIRDFALFLRYRDSCCCILIDRYIVEVNDWATVREEVHLMTTSAWRTEFVGAISSKKCDFQSLQLRVIVDLEGRHATSAFWTHTFGIFLCRKNALLCVSIKINKCGINRCFI